MGDPKIIPHTVFALLADAQPRAPLLPDGSIPRTGHHCAACGRLTLPFSMDSREHAEDCAGAEEWYRYRAAQRELLHAAPGIADLCLALNAEVERLRHIMAFGTSYSILDVLRILADAADHLHTVHGCDAHGYEVTRVAAEHARLILHRALNPEGSTP